MKFETNVKEIIPRTPNVRSFRFPRPPELDYKAGQFLFITIKQGGKELGKHFSFSSSPTEKEHIEFTKKFTDSEFSAALKTLKIGDWARIDAPYGQFTFEGEHPKIGMLAGGIGITPLVNICKYCTDKQLNTKIALLYGCRTEADIAFRKELEEMQQQNSNLKIVFTLNEAGSSWKGAIGVINTDMVKREIPDYKETIFYTCGPPAMVDVMEKLVESLGLPKTQLKREYFSGYTPEHS
ncbi:MAG TPA: FAD-dependent oxidoreductase [Candidatus Bathyarchaeia archaeon]|nr:FAD-dependent oxidoreductase [Candidatus Bathyarchaeia archaeon]